MNIYDQTCGCFCDKTTSRSTGDWELEQLRQQIADMDAEMERQCMEEISRRQVQVAENAADLYRYHAGVTEVIDVEPIESSSERSKR